MDSDKPGARERVATRLVFFVGGFTSAAWAPLVPFAKSRLGLDEGALGLVLLFFGLGALIAMPIGGWLAARLGCRKVIVGAVALSVVTLPLLSIVNLLPLFVVCLLLFGASIGVVDVVVNIQAIIVERAAGRSLMSGFHGGWSLGGFAGAGVVTLLFAVGLAPWLALLVAMVPSVALAALSFSGLLTYGGQAAESRRFVFPSGFVIGLALLSFIAFLAEGSVLDWGAVYLSSAKSLEMSLAGTGYTVFAIVMLVGRLTGDRVVQLMGGFRVLLFGGLIAATGFAVVCIAPLWWITFLGFALIGLGLSNVVPVLFSLVGKQTAMPSGQAMSLVGTVAYSGVLLGPAIIGGVAKLYDLTIGLALVAVLVLAITGSARIARR